MRTHVGQDDDDAADEVEEDLFSGESFSAALPIDLMPPMMTSHVGAADDGCDAGKSTTS